MQLKSGNVTKIFNICKYIACENQRGLFIKICYKKLRLWSNAVSETQWNIIITKNFVVKKKDPKPLNYTEKFIELHGQPAVLYTSVHKEDVLSQIRNAIRSALKANVERQLIESCVQDVFNNYDSQRETARIKSNCIYVLLIFFYQSSFLVLKVRTWRDTKYFVMYIPLVLKRCVTIFDNIYV